MYDMFKDFGTALYLRRGMQKRAYYGKKAVEYLEKKGAFEPQQYQQQYAPAQYAEPQQRPQEQQPQYVPQPPRQRPTPFTLPETVGLGLGAGTAGALAAKGIGKGVIKGTRLSDAAAVEALRQTGDKAAHDAILSRNKNIRGFIRRARNPLLAAGLLSGGVLAGAHVLDRNVLEQR